MRLSSSRRYLDDKDSFEWARNRIRKTRASAHPTRSSASLSHALERPSRLNNEIRKVAAAASSVQLSRQTLSKFWSPVTSRESAILRSPTTLVAGQKGKTMATLKRLLDDGVEPVALVGSIAYVYRRLLMAKDLMEKGAAGANVTRPSAVIPPDHESLFAAARRAQLPILSKRSADRRSRRRNKNVYRRIDMRSPHADRGPRLKARPALLNRLDRL